MALNLWRKRYPQKPAGILSQKYNLIDTSFLELVYDVHHSPQDNLPDLSKSDFL